MKEIRPYLVIFSAILSIFAYPPFPLGILIFISLACLVYAVENISPWRAFKFGYLWGLVYNLGLLYYIAWVTVPGMIATVMILALIPASGLWIFTRLIEKNRALAIISFPSFILMWNWLLTKSDLNYPWTDLGYALSYYTTLIQAADIAGIYLVSLFILAVNMLIYLSISDRFAYENRKRSRFIFISLILILAFYIYGDVRLSQLKNDPKDALTVGLIQGNITKDVKWAPGNLNYSFDTYHELSRQAVLDGAELVIWPETAIPTYLLQEPPSMAHMRRIVSDLKIPVLTGTVFYETAGPQ